MITWLLDLSLTPEQALAVVLLVVVLLGLIRYLWAWATRPIPVTLTRVPPATVRTFAPAPSWYTRDLDRDEVIGRDQVRPERQAVLDAAQADQRKRLDAAVRLPRRSLD